MKLTNQGFTLTELLIAIVIMAIIAGIGATNYLTSLKRGNDGKRAADLSNLRNALEMYYLDQSPPAYPDPDALQDLANSSWFVVDETNLDSLTPGYLRDFPSDPKTGRNYLFKSGGDCYCLSAKMEIADNGNNAPTGCSHCPDADGGADTADDNCNHTLTCP